jgi:hypothetical protein
MHQIVKVAEVFRNKVDSPEAGIRVGCREGHVRVGEVALHPSLAGHTHSRRGRARAWMGNRVSWHGLERGDYGGLGGVGGRVTSVAVGVFAAWAHATGSCC